jgi:hypothetical protein
MIIISQKMIIIIVTAVETSNLTYYSSMGRLHLPIQELTTSLCNLLVLVHPEDGGDTILRNVDSYKSHTVSSPRR